MSSPEKSVAFIFSGLYVGGAEKFGISLANTFAENGIKVIFILFNKVDSPYYQLIDSHIKVLHIKRKGKFDWMQHKPFEQILKEQATTDVVFFCLKPLLYTRFRAGVSSYTCNYYVTLHSTIPVNYKEYLKTKLLLRFIRRTDTTIFICRNQQEYHASRYGFTPQRSAIIYNGIDTTFFRPGITGNPKQKREELQIPDKHRIILLVATLRPEKGHPDAIAALHILHRKFPQFEHTHLVFAGGGQPVYVEKLKEKVKTAELNDYVHFIGNQKDVRPWYEAADLFTLTSVSVETFSIAALEAMAYGLPLSLTRIGGAAEMIFDDQNGAMSEPGNPSSIADSWAKILSRNYDKNEIRKIAVSQFSIEKVFAAYQNILVGNDMTQPEESC